MAGLKQLYLNQKIQEIAENLFFCNSFMNCFFIFVKPVVKRR